MQSCHVAAAEGGLQVEAAGIAVYVHDFAGKPEAADAFGFHGFGVYLFQCDAAGCDDGFPQGSCSHNGDGKVLYGLHEGQSFVFGNLTYRFAAVEKSRIQNRRYQRLGQQLAYDFGATRGWGNSLRTTSESRNLLNS